MPAGADIELKRIASDFEHMPELLALIRRSFAYMDGRIDPPSSVHRLTEASLREKCDVETGIVAFAEGRIAGCVFIAERVDHFYLGKLAVDPEYQGSGVGRRLLAEAERIAVELGKPVLELQARVELDANHAAFARMGFVETGRTAHDGYATPTSVTMRKALA